MIQRTTFKRITVFPGSQQEEDCENLFWIRRRQWISWAWIFSCFMCNYKIHIICHYLIFPFLRLSIDCKCTYIPGLYNFKKPIESRTTPLLLSYYGLPSVMRLCVSISLQPGEGDRFCASQSSVILKKCPPPVQGISAANKIERLYRKCKTSSLKNITKWIRSGEKLTNSQRK